MFNNKVCKCGCFQQGKHPAHRSVSLHIASSKPLVSMETHNGTVRHPWCLCLPVSWSHWCSHGSRRRRPHSSLTQGPLAFCWQYNKIWAGFSQSDASSWLPCSKINLDPEEEGWKEDRIKDDQYMERRLTRRQEEKQNKRESIKRAQELE